MFQKPMLQIRGLSMHCRLEEHIRMRRVRNDGKSLYFYLVVWFPCMWGTMVSKGVWLIILSLLFNSSLRGESHIIMLYVHCVHGICLNWISFIPWILHFMKLCYVVRCVYVVLHCILACFHHEFHKSCIF